MGWLAGLTSWGRQTPMQIEYKLARIWGRQRLKALERNAVEQRPKQNDVHVNLIFKKKKNTYLVPAKT